MKTRIHTSFAYTLIAALVLPLCALGSVPECELQRGTRSFWDLKALDQAPKTFAVEIPCSNEYGRVEGVEPIWIEGEPYRGKPTRVFAWWGLPKGASAQSKVPAMVLVHGGGGTAFAKWVKTWNDRGYAAIAMDNCGKMPRGEADGKPHATHPWSGPGGWDASARQVDEPVTDQWTYHAVAAVLRSHAFLKAQPEVDASRIGLTGISWGGYLTSIVMSVDDRFVFAAPVYGCGWYDLNPQWSHMGKPEQYRKWLALWDPKNYIQDIGGGGVKHPVLWCCGTNDRWYPLDAVRRSCNEVSPQVPLSLSLKLRMPHGHPPAGDPKEIAAMADHYLKGGAPLVEMKGAWLRDGKLHVDFDAHGRKIVKAELLATTSNEAVLEKRPWTATPVAGFDGSKSDFDVAVPAEAVMFFANVVTEDGLVVSTRIFERADWGLVANPRNPATDWMPGKVGLFAHYLYGGDMAGKVADAFDVPGLVRQILDAKADYFCLTLGQNTGWMCAPNATYEKIAGYQPGERCCPRDIPAEIAAALKPHGVKFMLYLPCQPPNGDAKAEAVFGFPGNVKGDRVINRSAAREWAKVIEEWSRRYGDSVAGWWFDGGYRHIRFDDEIAEIYAAACKRGNPKAVVAFNEGVKSPMRPWTQAGDYLAGEINEPLQETCAGRSLGDRQWQMLTYCGKTWGRPDCRFTDEQWIAWMKPVLAKGGAVTVDVHIDRPTGRLQPEQVAQMKRVFAAARAR